MTLKAAGIPFSAGQLSEFRADGGVIDFAAGGQSVGTSGSATLVFSNSNGLSFGLNADGGSVLTASYTVPDVAAFLTTAALSDHSHGNPTLALTGLTGTTASASNGLTLSLSAAAQSIQTQNSVLIQGSSGQITFSASNGVTFGGNARTITASVETSYAASNHSHGDPTLALTNLSGTTASASNGLTISLSAADPSAGGVAVSAAGSSQNAGTIVFSNSNGVSFGMNGSTITATVNPGAAAGIAAIQGGTQTATSGTVVFANSNGITFGMSGTSQITASHNGLTTAALSNHSHGDPTLALTNLSGTTASASNGLTLSLSAAATVAQTNQTAGFYATGNTTQNSSTTFDARSITFNGLGAATLGFSNGSMQVSVPVQTAQTQSNVQGLIVSDTTYRTGDVSFKNANGITFGSSGANVVTASYTVPSVAGFLTTAALSDHSHGDPTLALTNLSGSTASASNGLTISLSAAAPGAGVAISAGTQSVSTGTMVFSNSNGITFGMSGSSRITASVETSYAASNHSHGDPTLALTNLSGTTASASNGLTISMSAAAQTAQTQSNVQGIIVSDTTYRTGDVSFSNANGISFGSSAGQAVTISHGLQFTSATSAITSNALHSSASRVINIVAATNNTGGGTASLSSNVSFSAANGITFYTSAGGAIAASHNALTTARASNDAVGLNTAQTNVTWTVNSSGISLNAAGYAGTGTSITGGASMTLDSLGLKFNGTALAGTGTTFAGANISGSITQNTAGVNLSLSVAAPGAAAENNWMNLLGANTAGNTSASGSTIGLSGVNLTLSGTNASQIVLSAPATSSLVGASGLSVSTNGSTISVYQGAVLSRFWFDPPGASSAGSAMTQGSMSFQRVFIPNGITMTRVDIPILIAMTSSAAANTGNLLISSGLVIYSAAGSTLNPIVGAFGTTTYTHASNTANYNSVTGPRFASFPIATALSPGEYFVGVQLSTNNNSSIGTATTAIAVAISLQHGAIYSASQWQEFGAATATSVNMRPFVGVAASVTATGDTRQMSQITQTGTALMRANIPVGFRG